MECGKFKITVSDHKDTKFWNQFTTEKCQHSAILYCFRPQRYKILKPIHNCAAMFFYFNLLFQTTKIQNFETNSQPKMIEMARQGYCFRPQRYKILKPIHNSFHFLISFKFTVSDHKDTKFWNQFTTSKCNYYQQASLFQTTKIQNFETNSQQLIIWKFVIFTVSDHKDTKFWNQFTTDNANNRNFIKLFQTTKIQNFETNSQLILPVGYMIINCFRPQRYKILKPIHNLFLFYISKLKTVSDHKDTKFWNQFTTSSSACPCSSSLFQTTKIQNFETNSQRKDYSPEALSYCFRPQRYKILKPIHNKAIS